MKRPATDTPEAQQPVLKRKTLREITPFATTVFCAILNWSGLLESEDERIVRVLLPEPLQALLIKLQQFKVTEENYHYSNFFSTLSTDEQELLAQLLLEQQASNETMDIEKVLGHCRTRYWKLAVRIFREQLQAAQSRHDHPRVTELMQKFNRLKQSMHEKGLL